MYDLIKNLIGNIPYIRRLKNENQSLKDDLIKWKTWKPPGHFYSPIPDISEIKNDEYRLFKEHVDFIEGIDINKNKQLEILSKFKTLYSEIPFKSDKNNNHRYYYDNEYYSYGDGITLYCMMRLIKPKKIVEVGSGYSSALMLDVNEQHFGNIEFIFIDPFARRLKRLLKKKDFRNIEIITQRVQNLSTDILNSLYKADIIFIDSSHVVKIGSDVNFILFEMLPRLKQGAYIHFHDIFYPFEYPKNWIYEGVAWNEVYAIRSFLQYNYAFEIEFFLDYLIQYHKEKIIDSIPLAIKNEHNEISIYDNAPGANLWLKKIR